MAAKYVDLSLSFEREGGVWVGSCLELGTSTFDDTLDACQEGLRELAVEHLDVLEEVGERAAFFKEWGITLHDAPAAAPPRFDIRGNSGFWAGTQPEPPAAGATFLKMRVFFVKDGEREAAGQLAGA